MDLGLAGKKAVITGASRGLGYAIAQGLAREGANLVINGRDQAALNKAAADLRSLAAGSIHAVAGDVSKPDFGDMLIKESAHLLGGIDLLVTNSGGPKTGKFETMADEDWMDALNLCFFNHIRLIRAALPFYGNPALPAFLPSHPSPPNNPFPTWSFRTHFVQGFWV